MGGTGAADEAALCVSRAAAQFFSLEDTCAEPSELAAGCEDLNVAVAAGGDTKGSLGSEDRWSRECRELRASKLNFQLAMHRERQRDQDVTSLLSRLDSLPSDRDTVTANAAATPTPTSAVAALAAASNPTSGITVDTGSVAVDAAVADVPLAHAPKSPRLAVHGMSASALPKPTSPRRAYDAMPASTSPEQPRLLQSKAPVLSLSEESETQLTQLATASLGQPKPPSPAVAPPRSRSPVRVAPQPPRSPAITVEDPGAQLAPLATAPPRTHQPPPPAAPPPHHAQRSPAHASIRQPRPPAILSGESTLSPLATAPPKTQQPPPPATPPAQPRSPVHAAPQQVRSAPVAASRASPPPTDNVEEHLATLRCMPRPPRRSHSKAAAEATAVAALETSTMADSFGSAAAPTSAWVPGSNWAPSTPSTSVPSSPAATLSRATSATSSEGPQLSPSASASALSASARPPPLMASAVARASGVPEATPEAWGGSSSPRSRASPSAVRAGGVPQPPPSPPPRGVRRNTFADAAKCSSSAGGGFASAPSSPGSPQSPSTCWPRVAASTGSRPSSPRFGTAAETAAADHCGCDDGFSTPRAPPSPRTPRSAATAPTAAQAPLDAWRGWTLRTTDDGSLFYFNAASGKTQWEAPAELKHVLGEWRQCPEDAAGGAMWRNDLLGASSAKDPRMTTNLLHAALDGDQFFVQLYAHAGGSFEAADGEGRTALHLGCAGGSEQLMMLLLSRCANVNALDSGGSTPLHWACRYGRSSLVGLLLQARATPDFRNNSGDTPAHEAAALGDVAALRWLLHARANPSARNGRGLTPLDVAARSDQRAAAELLRSAAARRAEESAAASAAASSHRYGRADAGYDESEDEGEYEDAYDDDGHLDASYYHRHGHESADGVSSPSSPAIKVVRAARPVLQGVRWVAARLFGGGSGDGGSPSPSQAQEKRQRQQRGWWFEDDLVDEASTASSDEEDGGDEAAYGAPLRMNRNVPRNDTQPEWLY
eukprot:TRINITY_DN23268_c0_g2_i1.p1 TRINITY_DN23268_c0_g2~~TRINITY_DN23268_c0_g2_i1.p1  ORF type:complete len:1000 (-),score=194.28 TRINITY_DN23268_c0_g2_i1:68-3067(-)